VRVERLMRLRQNHPLDAKCVFDGMVGKNRRALHTSILKMRAMIFSTEHAVSVGGLSLSGSFFLKTYENELDGFMNY